MGLTRKQIVGLFLSLAILQPVSTIAEEIGQIPGSTPVIRPVKELPADPYTVRNGGGGGGYLDGPGKLVYPGDKPQAIFTKTFLTLHGVFLAATVYDLEMTHQGLAHHRCVEQYGARRIRPEGGTMHSRWGFSLPLPRWTLA
jgi:hypothetical protein